MRLSVVSHVEDVACRRGEKEKRWRRERKGECSSEESQSLSPHSSRRDDCVLSPSAWGACWVGWECVCRGGYSLVKAEGPCRDLDFCCPQTQSHVLCLAAPSLLCPASGRSGREGRWGEVGRRTRWFLARKGLEGDFSWCMGALLCGFWIFLLHLWNRE